MPNQKNIIVPLSSFIKINTTAKTNFILLLNMGNNNMDALSIVKTRFFNLFTSNPKNEHEQLRQRHENLIDQFLSSQCVTDFNLGKKTKQEFVDELTTFFSFDADEPKHQNCGTDPTQAWNSLVAFDDTSLDHFKQLIKLTEEQAISIYFITDTNILHAQEIINLFNEKSSTQLNLPTEINRNKPIKIAENFYLCPSYNYQTLIEPTPTTLFSGLFKESNLIAKVVNSLENKDIIFVSDKENEKMLAKQLSITVSSIEDFCNPIKNNVSTAVTSPASNKLFALSTTSPEDNSSKPSGVLSLSPC